LLLGLKKEVISLKAIRLISLCLLTITIASFCFSVAYGKPVKKPIKEPISAYTSSSSAVSINDGIALPPSESEYEFWTSDNYWHMKIVDNPTLAPNSNSMINWLFTYHSQYPTISWQKWTHPIYRITDPSTPVYTVHDNDHNRDWQIPFPDPYPIKLPDDADRGVTIIDYVRGNVWHLGETEAVNGGYRVRAAWRYDLGGSGLSPIGVWTVGGSGSPKAGYMILPEEIEAGYINHALGCCLKPVGPFEGGNKYSMNTGFVYPPATSTDRKVGSTNSNEIPEGARIQLDPSINLDSLGLSRTGKIIAKAMQEYGIVCCEAGGGWNIYAEHDLTADWNPPEMNSGVLSPLGALPSSAWRVIDFDLYPVEDDLSEYALP
jgi:hypothetical protein